MSLFSFLFGDNDESFWDKITESLKEEKSSLSKYKQTEVSYDNTIAVKATPETVKMVADQCTKISSSRRVTPPPYYEYVSYAHRLNGTIHNLRLGDVSFVIPPEFIAVQDRIPTDSVGMLRHRGSIKVGRGYSRKDISLTLYVNGLDQINGYKVKGPGGDFYVDGLRPLLAQFMVCPYVPVVNELLNEQLGIYNVALNNMMVSTVDGYPNTFEVTLIMNEVSLTPYTELPDVLYHDMIDWDLFRFNYQRLMSESSGVKTVLPKVSELYDGRFSLLQIKPDKLSGDNIENYDIFDIANFETVFSTAEDGVIINNLSFNVSNIVPVMQLSNLDVPTSQYLGGTDVTFNITFETTDENLISKIRSMSSMVQFLTKQYKEFGTFGFVRIENELIKMTGVEFVVVDNITYSTVPGFPGLYQISISCVEFDLRQKEREAINGMTPFPDGVSGTKDDAITQDAIGWRNKILQDNAIESKLSRMEMYPDLHLPLLVELDEHIDHIIKFRNDYNLEQIKYLKYPRAYSITPGEGPQGSYEVFADPDFYVFYPVRYSDLNNSVFDDFNGCKKMEPVKTTVRSVDYGDEPPDGYIYDADGNLVKINSPNYGNSSSSNSSSSSATASSVAGQTNNALANLIIQKANEGCGYVWATDGQMYNETLRRQLERVHGASNYIGTEKWYGKQVFDCSGIICWALRELGVAPAGYRVINSQVFSEYTTPISKSELKPGDLVNRGSEHIGVYIGDGKTAEAMSTEMGVVIGQLGNRYTEFGRLKKDLTVSSTSSSGSHNTSTHNTSTSSSDTSSYVTEERLNKFLKNGLAGCGKYYIQSSKKYGLNPAFTVALSCQETGWGTASAIKTHNNPGGIMDWDNGWKTLRRFSTIADGIEFVHKNLYDTYISQGLTTIEQIGAKYAPVPAANDPNGLNRHWVPNITSMYKDITGESTVKVTLGEGDSTVLVGDGSAGSGTISSVTYKRKNNHGTVVGDKVVDFAYKNFGMPIFLESPANAVFNQDKVSEVSSVLLNGAIDSAQSVLSGIAGTYNLDKVTFLPQGVKDIYGLYGKLMKPVGWVASGVNAVIDWVQDLWIVDTVFNWVGGVIGWGYDILFSTGDEDYNNKVKAWHLKEEEVLNTMYVDMMLYNHRGRMTRAFPTYMLLLADEAGQWLDGRKLWSNYYMYKSVIDISVHQERSQPVHTAKLTITNVHHNLNSKPKAKDIKVRIEEDPEYNKVIRWIYEKTGSLIGTPKLTDKMVEVKNKTYDVINIKPGLNIHIRMGYGSNPIMYPTVFSGYVTDLSVGDTVDMVAQSYGVELINTVISAKPNKTNSTVKMGSEPSNVISYLLTARENELTHNINKRWGEANKFGIEHCGIPRSSLLNLESDKEYDLIKNIYFGKYNPKLLAAGAFANFDGENNANFYLYNKTPWDVAQYMTQTLPEFVCQPMYHQFDCRLFFGLPHWLSKYRYDLFDGKISESGKAFSQFHYIDSVSDIIDNNVKSSSDGLQTNCVAMYTLGSDVKSAPTVYSDRSIYPEYQKTNVIDTTLEQDYIGPDWLYEKTLAPVAKNAAIKMAISNLIDSWNNVYQNEFIILGDASIKPCDYVMVNDMYVGMSGLTGVREVVHSMSVSSGFTTSITPDLIAMNNQKYSGVGNIYKSLVSFGMAYGAVKGARMAITGSLKMFEPTVSVMRKMADSRYEDAVTWTAISALPNYAVGKLMMDMIGSGKIITSFKESASLFAAIGDDALKALKGIKTIKKVGSIKSVAKVVSGTKQALALVSNAAFPGVGYVVAWTLGTVVFDMLLGATIDEFAYNNSITLFPLTYKNEPLVSGTSGQTKLIPGITDGDKEAANKMEDKELKKDNDRNNNSSE